MDRNWKLYDVIIFIVILNIEFEFYLFRIETNKNEFSDIEIKNAVYMIDPWS
jgi:hypothetical protein